MELSNMIIRCLLSLFISVILYRSYYGSINRKEKGFLSVLPVVGFRKQWFGWIRATVLSIFKTKDWAFEGYREHCKRNIPFVIPSIDRGPMVIIPPRQLKKVYSAPESAIDIHYTSNETIQTKWTIWDKEVSHNNFQMNVIRNQLTRNLDKITPRIVKEFETAFPRWWGTSKEWKSIHVWDVCLKLVAGASNAVFIGAPLCRDEKFLGNLRDHAMSIFLGAMVINTTPKLLKPIVGFSVGWTCYYLFRKTLRGCLPVVQARLENTAKLKADASFDWTPPHDCLQWIIDECYASGDPTQLDPKRVAHRLVFLNDISLHSTAFMAQNFILDLFSTDPALGYVDTLREECERVLKEAGGVWTRSAVIKLKLVDSAIRESMRIRPFAIVGLPRTVVHPEGILLEDSGIRIPRGTLLAVPLEPVHYDETYYPEAHSFNPFRFANPDALRSLMDTFTTDDDGEKTKGNNAGEDTERRPSSTGKPSVTLDEAFLGFGFGKHACPGRFFALHEVKIFVAHMLLNYEVEYMKTRPEPLDTVWLKLPLHGGKIRVRRRV